MRVEIVNPFVVAASEVLESELGAQAERGNLRLQMSACTTDEVTIEDLPDRVLEQTSHLTAGGSGPGLTVAGAATTASDVSLEELEKPAYRETERIAAVGAILVKPRTA